MAAGKSSSFLNLPAVFTATHDTAGLSGFPAIDEFAPAGTPVTAPVSGTIVDVHGIPWNQQQRVGGETAYLQGDNGKTYFLTHLGGNVPSGKIQAGQQIGVVGAVPNGWWQSHIHEGEYNGLYQPGSSGSSAPVTSSLVGKLNAALSQFPNLDANAVRAVASQEGLGGGVGDNGTSFGPFQLHQGGALPSSISLSQGQNWAWSPQGLNYALGAISKVAGGLKGKAAINAIVSQFERPANVPKEIAGANAAYGSVPTGGTQSPTQGSQDLTGAPTALQQPPQQVVAQQQFKSAGTQFALSLLDSAQNMLGGGSGNLSQLFSVAKGYQQAKKALGPPPIGGGSSLQMKAGGLKA